MDARPRSLKPIALGLASHVLAGVSPFIFSRAIARFGLIPATALIYGIGAVGLLVSLGFGRWRRAFVAESAAVWRSPFRTGVLAGLAGFLVAGISYYYGLARSPRVAEYVFVTRFDWILQAPVAILLLREPWTGRGLVGGAVALAGGALLIWTGSLGTQGLSAALIYILASLAGYTGFKPAAAARGSKGAVILTVWRHWVNALGFAALLVVQPSPAIDPAGFGLAAGGAAVIIALFLLRFTAMTGLPLWVLSVQAPVQGIVAILMTFATGGTLPAQTLIAIGLVVAGESIVAVSEARRAGAR